MSANMDGSNVTVFVKTGLQLPNDVKIDIYSGRLCFIDAGLKYFCGDSLIVLSKV